MPFVAAHLAVAGLVSPAVTLAAYGVLAAVSTVLALRATGRGPGLPAAAVALLCLPVAGAAGFRLLSFGTAASGPLPPALAGATAGLALVTAAALALRNRAWNAGTVATATAGAGVTIAAAAQAGTAGGATWFGTYGAAALLATWLAARGFRPPDSPPSPAAPGWRGEAGAASTGHADGEATSLGTYGAATRGFRPPDSTPSPAAPDWRGEAGAASTGHADGAAARSFRPPDPTPPPAAPSWRAEADAASTSHADGGATRLGTYSAAARGFRPPDPTPSPAAPGWRGEAGAASARHAGAAAVPLVLSVVSLLPTVLETLLRPLGWVGAIWRGAPGGVGLGPDGTAWWPAQPPAFGAGAAAVTLAVLAGAAVLVAGRFGLARWSLAAPPVLLAVVLGCVAAGAPWPVVPAVTLATGLVTALGAALRRPSPGTAVAAVTCWFGIVPGLSGALAAAWSTLAALGAVVVAGVVAGVAGRTLAARAAAWPIAGVAGAWLAFAAGQAAQLPLRATAYLVLGAAAAALAGGHLLRGRRGEGRLLDAVAHAVAAVAFLLAVADLAAGAGVAGLWGVALGLRALPGRARVAYTAGAVVAELVAYELVLVAGEVSLTEAYTAPVALAALAAGWFAARGNPGLTSWTAFGPGLLAGLLPSLALVIVTPGAPGRRLVLGAVAVAVVLAGARLRLKAPIAAGGAVLAVLAWHEVLRFWDHLPRWAPLALAGALLVGFAVTYERRIRDLTRLRDAVGRMR
jgi:hypothetical protein